MNLKVVEYNNIRVLTTQQIADAYETDTKQISYNFNHNKGRYKEGKHYILLTGDDLRAFREIHDLPSNINKVYLWTEKGAFLHAKSLNTDKAWEMYEKLVDFYFATKQAVNEELSPELQLLQGIIDQMKRKEFEDKERDRQIALTKETLSKVTNTTERIKDALVSPFENWREDINKKVNQISHVSGIPHQGLFTTLYEDLERTARCDLSVRQRNKRNRMERAGCTKTDIQKETTKIAVIEDDARLKQIFEDIVRKYGAKYIA